MYAGIYGRTVSECKTNDILMMFCGDIQGTWWVRPYWVPGFLRVLEEITNQPQTERYQVPASMSALSNWLRNRLLLALPSLDLGQLMPELEHIRCEREQVLIDANSLLDHIFSPTAVLSRRSRSMRTAASLRWQQSAERVARGCRPSSEPRVPLSGFSFRSRVISETRTHRASGSGSYNFGKGFSLIGGVQ
jgi:hypothetical protein